MAAAVVFMAFVPVHPFCNGAAVASGGHVPPTRHGAAGGAGYGSAGAGLGLGAVTLAAAPRRRHQKVGRKAERAKAVATEEEDVYYRSVSWTLGSVFGGNYIN